MTKIVINRSYGGFGLSEKAQELLGFGGEPSRDDPRLIEVVEQLGDDANGTFAELRVVEIPDGVNWCIKEYDGVEWIAEEHRTWR